MNAIKSKLLLTLAKNKKKDEGFTLIELLVVIIIIGVLSAVALPNLLSQVGKARETEAKNGVGSINRAQQAYFTEESEFAFPTATNSLDDVSETLGVGIQTEFYDNVTVAGGAATSGVAFNNSNAANDGTRDYGGGTFYNSNNQTFETIVCRATDVTAGLTFGNISNTGCGSDGEQVGG